MTALTQSSKARLAGWKKEGRDLAFRLVSDPVYLLTLQKRLLAGDLHPSLERYLLEMALGKPVEQIDVRKESRVRIIHEYTNGPLSPAPLEAEVLPTPDPTEVSHDPKPD
jgi:hypothetical protein